MPENDFHCGQNCRNTCSMLNEALRKETTSVKFYESVIDQCATPEVKVFLNELMETRRVEVLKIIQKLNEIRARSQALDGIASSFNTV
ncbi:MAG: hypothetical protein HYV28_13130 [Ignavibacteriales bacterium]|nr:hypothetical protein [Ignavibacteriales bacterium]